MDYSLTSTIRSLLATGYSITIGLVEPHYGRRSPDNRYSRQPGSHCYLLLLTISLLAAHSQFWLLLTIGCSLIAAYLLLAADHFGSIDCGSGGSPLGWQSLGMTIEGQMIGTADPGHYSQFTMFSIHNVHYSGMTTEGQMIGKHHHSLSTIHYLLLGVHYSVFLLMMLLLFSTQYYVQATGTTL